MEVGRFLEAFGSWASSQPDIEGVALVGSYARDAATEESDFDLIILTTKVAKYFQNQSWLSQFGDVEDSKVEDWGRVTSLRAFYENGLEVEFNFSTPDWADIPMDAGTYRVVTGGMIIVYDPQCVLRALQQGISPPAG